MLHTLLLYRILAPSNQTLTSENSRVMLQSEYRAEQKEHIEISKWISNPWTNRSDCEAIQWAHPVLSAQQSAYLCRVLFYTKFQQKYLYMSHTFRAINNVADEYKKD